MSGTARRAHALLRWFAFALLSFRALAEGSSLASETQNIKFEALFTSRHAPAARISAERYVLPRVVLGGEGEVSARLNLGQAWVSLGDMEDFGWSIDAGRQRLSYGDERLLGANREFGWSPPGWDCLRLKAGRGRISAEILSGFSKYHRATLHGAFTSIRLGEASIEPYWLRKNGDAPVTAAGIRAVGTVRSFAYNVEIVSESAGWAGHWEATRTFGPAEAGLEWNFATPKFDEFFPARLNQFNTEDPFGWTDTANTAFNYTHRLRGKVKLASSFRTYWTASGEYLTTQLIAGISWEQRNWSVSAACGRLMAARVNDVPRWTPFAGVGYRF
jgi:hypothetical protein